MSIRKIINHIALSFIYRGLKTGVENSFDCSGNIKEVRLVLLAVRGTPTTARMIGVNKVEECSCKTKEE
jgi:hypothetical protein